MDDSPARQFRRRRTPGRRGCRWDRRATEPAPGDGHVLRDRSTAVKRLLLQKHDARRFRIRGPHPENPPSPARPESGMPCTPSGRPGRALPRRRTSHGALEDRPWSERLRLTAGKRQRCLTRPPRARRPRKEVAIQESESHFRLPMIRCLSHDEKAHVVPGPARPMPQEEKPPTWFDSTADTPALNPTHGVFHDDRATTGYLHADGPLSVGTKRVSQDPFRGPSTPESSCPNRKRRRDDGERRPPRASPFPKSSRPSPHEPGAPK
jgi:hypothetical protein